MKTGASVLPFFPDRDARQSGEAWTNIGSWHERDQQL